MRKKFTLMFVALLAMAGLALAAATTWKVTAEAPADTDGTVAAGTVLIDDDLLKLETVYATKKAASEMTIAGEAFTNYFQVRVNDDPTATTPTGTEKSGSTPLVLTAKKNLNVTLYYCRQSTAVTDNKGTYAADDNKDLKTYEQSGPSLVAGTLTIDSETEDGNYGYATKEVSLEKGKTYTICARGTTVKFYGISYDKAEAPTSYFYQWPGGSSANSITLAEGVTVAITGNTSKSFSSSNAITVDGKQYTTIKNSNGAQNTLTLPVKAKSVTFYSFVNKNASDATNDSYWKEVNGVSYDAETSGGKMTSFKDYANPDKRKFTFDTPTNVITFNNAGYQLCFVVEVEYADAVTTLDFTTLTKADIPMSMMGEDAEMNNVSISDEAQGAKAIITAENTLCRFVETGNGIQLNPQAGTKIRIEPIDNTKSITKVVFNATEWGDAPTVSSDGVASELGQTTYANDTWTGKASYVEFTMPETNETMLQGITVTVEDEPIIAAINNATTDEVTYTLEADAQLVNTVNVPLGKKLVLDGAGHTLSLGTNGNFVLQDGITLKNLKIDATALTAPLIAMGDTTNTGKHNKVLFAGVEGYSNINQNAWILENPVIVDGCMIKNLATPIFDAKKYSWALNELTFNNNIIQLNNDANAFINMDGASCAIAKVLNITKNTIYNLKDNSSKFFIKGSNASNTQPKKIYGTTAADTYVWTITNNTMAKTFTKKAFANSTPSINTVTITMKSNVFVDVLQIQKLFGNCKKDIDKSTNIIFGKEITIDNTDKNTYCTEASPGFTTPTTALDLTAEKGGIDLTLGASTLAAKVEAGDPRWLPAGGYVKSFSALVNMALAEVEKGAVSVKLFEDYTGEYKDDAAITIPLDKQLTIDGDGHTLELGAATNFVLIDGFTLKNLKIDATALTAPLIAMGDTTNTGKHNKVLFAGVEGYENINQNAWILEKPVVVDGCMIKNLATPIFDAKKYSWALNELTLNNNIIQLNNDANAFINMDGAGCAIAKVLNITKNTIYNLKDNSSKFFIKGSNASNTQPKKIYGTTAADTYVWTIQDNTMVKTFTKKAFANSTPSINTVTITMKSNVFVDVLQIQKLFGNCKKDIDKSTNIIFGKEITIDNTDKNTYCTEADPGFDTPTTALDLEAENGGIDLTVGNNSIAAYVQAGDPRWLKDFVAPAYFIGTEDNMTQLEYNKDAKKYEYEFTLDQITKYVIENDENTQYYLQGKDGAEDLMGEKNVVLDTEYGLVPVQLLRGAYNIEASTLVFMPGTYKVTITPSYPYYNIVITGTPDNSDSDGTLVVVDAADGDAFHFGEDGTDNGHMMTMIDATGLYLKIYEGVVLGPGYYPFHIVANNADDAEGGQGGVIISEGGKYDVAIVYDPVLDRVSVNAVKSGTTGIDGITIDELINGAIFNLNGQRVNSAKKGLYIINGHKVVIK